MQLRALGAGLLLALTAGCAAQVGHPLTAVPLPASAADWGFTHSDIRPDATFRYGRLPNGMRYIVAANATPKGTGLVRMRVAAGALDESDAERGLAHFVEHMAFEGSTHVPEGEMVKLLEREGLAFGADTNAATGYDATTYMLDLPQSDPRLLDTALMLMRETASELTFDASAVACESGVVLAEKRDRNSFAQRNYVDQTGFVDPAAIYAQRMPIGLEEVVRGATPAQLRAFWARNYVPAKTTLVVIGDFDADAVEAAIKAHFADWSAKPSPPQPSGGPMLPGDHGRSEIYLDPALTDRITALRHGVSRRAPDTLARRREDLLAHIGYAIVNRRLEHLGRQSDPPFRDAGFGTAEILHAGRTTNLIVDAISGRALVGLSATAGVWHRALAQGFAAPEVAEQVANIRAAAQHAAAGADTRSDALLLQDALALLSDQRVPSPPADVLARFEAFAPSITPALVLTALRHDAVMLDDPLLRFQGRLAPPGGAAAMRAAWNAAVRAPFPTISASNNTGFAYQDFGKPGTVVSDNRETALGIRQVRYANGVRLNLRHTDLAKDQVLVEVNVDGGRMLATRADPLAVEMVAMLGAGGLGRHSEDELQSLLAGHSVTFGLNDAPETFAATAATTPADLALQLRLTTALLTDPGYRGEGEVQYRLAAAAYFAQLRASPQAALAGGAGGILSDQDPRFTLQKFADYQKLDFARLRADITDRLAHGAIEVAMIGDMNEDRAIALVGATLGALPAREPWFGLYLAQRRRGFTQDHAPRILRHTGPADQALIQLVWHTTDSSDPVEVQRLNLLSRCLQLGITEALRQKLGKAYSPAASSEMAHEWLGYGEMKITATVSVVDVPAARIAIAGVVADLRDHPVSGDLLQRARAPLVEQFDNRLKTNSGWLAVAARSQSQPGRIDRQTHATARLLALSAADVQAAAHQYLPDAGAVAITVLPDEAPPVHAPPPAALPHAAIAK